MLIEIISATLQQTGIPIFIGSAVLGAVIGWGFKKFNLVYLATHEVFVLLCAFSLGRKLNALFRLIKPRSGMEERLLLKFYNRTM